MKPFDGHESNEPRTVFLTVWNRPWMQLMKEEECSEPQLQTC